jgi:dTDP-4-amino-4,6-dideoxygalactose transaminase
MRVLRVHGGKPKYYHAVIGGNFRIDELQAAVLRVKLKYLDHWTHGRQRNAAFYDAAFADAHFASKLATPHALKGGRHIFNQYIVRAQKRDALKDFLGKRGVGTEIYYPVPLHLQKCFDYLQHRAGDFPESERAALETLALPIYPELAPEQLKHVVASIGEFYG